MYHRLTESGVEQGILCFRLKWRTGSLVPPNPPLELTPLRGTEIVPFLSVGFCLTAFLIYRGGRADALLVGRHVSSQL
jgi:hypothetical protein